MEEIKRLILEAELEEKRKLQEQKHEMEMQSMMISFLQQMQYTNQGVHNPPLYGREPSIHAVCYPPDFFPHQSPSDNHVHDNGCN